MRRKTASSRRVPVIGLGAGGHAKVVIEALRLADGFEVKGLLDPRPELKGRSILGVPVLGDDSLLPGLIRQGVRHAFVGVGSVGDTRARRGVYERLRAARLVPLTIVHPAAVVAASASLGEGTVILARAVVGPDARVGANVIVNTGAVVEHDCVIGDHVHVATGALIAGGVTVEEGAHVGLGACLRQGVRIGRNAVVGAGAVIVRDVPKGLTIVGVPPHQFSPENRKKHV